MALNNLTAGTCYTGSECSSRGGAADGACASGFGVCCSFSRWSGDRSRYRYIEIYSICHFPRSECDTSTAQNGTYFSSPASPPSVCSLMITPLSEAICQVTSSLRDHQQH